MEINDGTVKVEMEDVEMRTCVGDVRGNVGVGRKCWDGTKYGRSIKGDKRKG